MDAACIRPELADNPAYQYALLYTLAMGKGVNLSVQMPYAEALAPLSEWYCQLWAESLGKAVDADGNPARTGQTPVRALGVTDQHSQVQLYNEGPYDKIISFWGVKHFHSCFTIPDAPIKVGEVSYLCGQSLNHLIAAEQRATVYAVTEAGQLNNSIWMDEINAYTLGKLFFFFEMTTAAAGEFLHIDAFDQPGVEAGKIATFALMGRKGYEAKAAELNAAPKTDTSLIYTV